tara:strand:+ start:12 stop:1055 length:1044 start_codon:yes stop_codon:yes gene_type:complete
MKISYYFFILFPFISYAQNYNIGNTEIEFYDETRNRIIPTQIYYPSEQTGENVSISNSSFPIIVFGHGFLIGWETYSNFCLELVPKGYIVCFPTTEMSFSPNHEEFGQDLKYVANEMIQLDNQISSIFFNSIMPKSAIMGHSMGGGASFLSSTNNISSITTLINFAAAETSPSAISAALDVDVPTLIFAGEEDCVTPPTSNQIPMYDATNASCKTLININNGGHCYFANDNFVCDFGESSCSSGLNISREEQQDVTFDFLNLWLDYTLYNDEYALVEFNDSLQTSIRINYQQSCESVNINEDLLLQENPSTLIKRIDLLGREQQEHKKGSTLFYIYNDGKVEKKFTP